MVNKIKKIALLSMMLLAFCVLPLTNTKAADNINQYVVTVFAYDANGNMIATGIASPIYSQQVAMTSWLCL